MEPPASARKSRATTAKGGRLGPVGRNDAIGHPVAGAYDPAVRFLRFWRRALATGGTLALTLGGLVTAAVGGSAIAYLEVASHRAVWVITSASPTS